MKAMRVRIVELGGAHDDAYREFLRRIETSLVYHTPTYREFIAELAGGVPEYLLALGDDGAVRGALPLFLKHGRHGTVCNSLPFFGSIGGAIGDDEAARAALVAHYNRRIEAPEIAAATVIENPLETRGNGDFAHDLTDYRIGQVSILDGPGDADERLMASFHYKTRNMIRKAEKSGVAVEIDEGAYDFLERTHVENIGSIGGLVKPPAFFELIQRKFRPGTDRRLYVARHEGQPIAACLMLYFNRTVEYFIPVIKVEHREKQPLSLVIFQAMVEAARDGYRWWNWGGTWQSQEGVYRFKKRWGTRDRNYFYYTRVRNHELPHLSREEILAAYPYYFVLPFAALTPRAERP
jgi:hypothetical protein